MQKKKTGRKILVTGIIMVLTTAFCSGCGLFSKEVEFQDPLVERCVRMTLEKDADEKITEKECASIEELLIDCDLDIGLTFNMMFASVPAAPANYIDLCDLKYMTGLKALVIDNRIERDNLVNMDVIANCKELEELTMQYNALNYKYYTGAPKGYRYLSGILKDLPELKYINLGYPVPSEYQEMLAGENTDLDFEDDFEEGITGLSSNYSLFAGAEDAEEYVQEWDYTYEKIIGDDEYRKNQLMIIEDENQLEDFLEELPKDIEDICIAYSPQSIDMELFTEYEHLKTITVIANESMIGSMDADEFRKIKNLDSLEACKELFALNLCRFEFDPSEMEMLTQIRELSLWQCVFEEADFLGNMPELRELVVYGNDGRKLPDYLEDNGENHEKLKYLAYENHKTSAFRGIEDYINLETLLVYFGSNPTTFENIAQCKNLKNLYIDSVEKEWDISDLKQCEQLETLVIYSSIPADKIDGIEEVLEIPKLVTLSLPIYSGWGEASDDMVEEINEYIDIAVQSDTLSCVMPELGAVFTNAGSPRYATFGQIDLDKLHEEEIMTGIVEAIMFGRPDKFPTWKDAKELFDARTSAQ